MELTIILPHVLPPLSSVHFPPLIFYMIHMCAVRASVETQAFVNERKRAMFVLLNLSYLGPTISNCICFQRNNRISFFFIMTQSIICIYITLAFYVGRHTGWFYSLAIVHRAKKTKTQTNDKKTHVNKDLWYVLP